MSNGVIVVRKQQGVIIPSKRGPQGAPGAAPDGVIFASGAGIYPSLTNGCGINVQVETAVNKVNVVAPTFEDTGDKRYAEFGCVMPTDWDALTLAAKFLWLSAGVVLDDVVWGLQAVSFGDGETIDAPFGVAQEVTDTNSGTPGQVMISDQTPPITVANTPAAGDFVQFRCYRDSAPVTLAETVSLLGISISFTRA